MNKEVWIGKKGFRYWYYKVRDSEYYSLSLIGFTVAVCLFLVSAVIVPQVSNWFSIREETIAARNRISVLQNNINYLNGLDRNTLEKEMQTVTNALPTEKDFGSILQTISNNAITTGVSVDDYSFQVGSLKPVPQTGVKGPFKDISNVRVTVQISGSLQNIKRYIQNMQLSLPLAQVVNIDGSGTSYTLGIEFYQKDFPKILVNDDTPLTDLTAEEQGVMQRLMKMQQIAPAPVILPDSIGSDSAVPLF